MRSILVLLALLFISGSASRVDQPLANSRSEYPQEVVESGCNQSTAERNALMTRAESENFTVRRVEFLGLRTTPDQVVRPKMSPFVNEGDIFSRKKLAKSLQSMSKLTRRIHPVGMKDVVIELREPQVVDMLICFKERRR